MVQTTADALERATEKPQNWDFVGMLEEVDSARDQHDAKEAHALELELEKLAERDVEASALLAMRHHLAKKRQARAAGAAGAAAEGAPLVPAGGGKHVPMMRAQLALDRVRGRSEKHMSKAGKRAERAQKRRQAKNVY
jgi:hypothetical protein